MTEPTLHYEAETPTELMYFNKVRQMKIVIRQLTQELGKEIQQSNNLQWELDRTNNKLKSAIERANKLQHEQDKFMAQLKKEGKIVKETFDTMKMRQKDALIACLLAKLSKYE